LLFVDINVDVDIDVDVDVDVDVDGDQVIGLGEVGSGPLAVKHCVDAEWPMKSRWVNHNKRLRGRKRGSDRLGNKQAR
jgi:hypothetical protein